MILASRQLGLAVTLALLATTLQAQTPLKELIAPIPEDANAIVIIQADKLRSSVFAEEFRAKTLRGTSNVDKHLIPREDIRTVVLGAELNIVDMRPIWEAAIIEISNDISVETLNIKIGGIVESFGDLPALLLPSDAYLIKLGSKRFGTLGPANRQKAARWAMRASSPSEAKISPYLAKMAEFPETVGTEVMLALDLSGLIDATRLRARLDGMDTLKARPQVNRDELARLLSGVQGIALGVKATETLNARLRIDFSSDPSMLKDFAKPLIIEVIKRQGLMIDEIEGWDVTINGNTVFLGGDLTAGGLRRVLTLVDPPTFPSSDATKQPDTTPSDPKAVASQQYFHEITKLLSDMADPENRKYQNSSGWYDRYARKIDQLPLLNVDPELSEYGSNVAQAFRTFAYKGRAEFAKAADNSSNLERNVTVLPAGSQFVGAVGGWYGGYSSVYNTYSWQVGPPQGLSQRQKAEKTARSYMAMSLAELRNAVGAATSDIRRKMTEKYQVEF
jgi:hypothetical protein